jgi:hypothetical protein
MRYNDMSDGERRRLLKGEFGKQLLMTMAKSVAAIHWGDGQGMATRNNGSMFFVNTGRRFLGVTARHVYDGFVDQASRSSDLSCQINSLPFNPVQRLLGLGHDCDVATFEVTPDEILQLEKITVPWPPVIPTVGHAALLAGMPGIARSNPQRHHVDFGVYLALGVVESVNDRDISLVKRDNSELIDTLGKGLPPPAFDLGGMSGGPIAAIQENHGILSWNISGVIYQNHQSFEIMKAVRADLISTDGSIRVNA